MPEKTINSDKDTVKSSRVNLRVGLTLASVALAFFLGIIAKYVFLPV